MGMIYAATLEAIRVQFEAKFQDVARETPTWSDTLATPIPSSAESNVYGWLENELMIREWVEERELQALRESEYRLTNKHYEGTIRVDRNKIEDDTLDMFFGVQVPMFARKTAKFNDRQIADILLNNATAYDGNPFFDDDSRDNVNSGNLDLLADGVAFATTRAALRSFTDPTGEVRDVGDSFTLCVSPQKERIARIVVEAEFNTHASGDHSSNVQKGLASVLVIPELAANPNRWGLFATGLPIKPFIVQNRTEPQYIVHDNPNIHTDVFHKNVNIYGVDFRRAFGVSFPWLAYINDPDGAMT